MITAEPARFTQSAVARYEPTDRVPANSRSNSPNRLGAAHGLGDFGISGDMAGRDLQKRFPDLDLKRRADHVDVESAGLAQCGLHKRRDSVGVLEVMGLWPAGSHVAHRIVPAVLCGKGQTAQTPVRGHGKSVAKWRVAPVPIDGKVRALSCKLARCHSFPFDEEIMQAAGA